MKHIAELQHTAVGKNIALVGHGESVQGKTEIDFDGDIMSVNNPEIANMTHFLYADEGTDKWLQSGKMVLPEGTIKIGSQKCSNTADYRYHVHYFPPKIEGKPAFRSGIRAIFLAMFMDYDIIYLYGYDFTPQEGTFIENSGVKTVVNLEKSKLWMDSHLEQYKWVSFPEGKIVQTNKKSRLQFK